MLGSFSLLCISGRPLVQYPVPGGLEHEDTPGMPEDAYTPAGYCPRCRYAMDPGKCPECGTVVTADQLVREPNRVASWRRMRRAVILALIAVVALGGYCLYREGTWLTWLPNSLLLRFERSDWPRAHREILARYRAGKFSKAEIDGLLRRAFRVSAVYAQNVPANTPMPVSVVFAPTGPLRPCLQQSLWLLSKDEWAIQCDGRSLVLSQATGFSLNRSFAEVRLELPPLTSGRHDLTLQGTFGEPLPSAGNAVFGFTLPLQLQLSIIAEDRPLGDFVGERWSVELAEAVSKAIRASGSGLSHTEDPALYLRFESCPVAMAIEVFVRSPEEADYQPLTDWGGVRRLVCPRGASFSYGFLMPKGVAVTNRIDVQLRPRPQEALLRGQDECFMGTMEWRGLVLADASRTVSPQNTMLPTRVFRDTEDQRQSATAGAPATRPAS